MDYDKKERELNVLINSYINCKKDLKWAQEEVRLNEEKRANVDSQLFFLYIDRYLIISQHDIFDAQLEEEYRLLN